MSNSQNKCQQQQQKVLLRPPVATDGMAVFELIQRCPPLDVNSSYCNLLQCLHFTDTCVIAELGGEVVGFISGYLLPNTPQTLFIWQVAVDSKARGLGLATRMLQQILNRASCAAVTFMETTITEDNQASWALFTGFAAKQSAALVSSVLFDQHRHFNGQHDSETLVRIGPFTPQP